MARRIVGVDSPTVQANPQVPANVTLNTEAADQMWSRAAQANQEGFQAQQQALQAQSNAIAANTQALANKPVRSPLQEALDGVLSGIQVYGEISNQRAQAKAAKAEAERAMREEAWAANTTQAYRNITPALLKAREIIHTTADTEGVYTVQNELYKLIDSYDVSPEQREELYKYVQEDLGSYQQGQLSRLQETQRNEEAAYMDGVFADFQYQGTQFAAILKSSTDPNESFEAAAGLADLLGTSLAALPESVSIEQRLDIRARMVAHLATLVGDNAEGQLVLQQAAEQQQLWNDLANDIEAQYANDPIRRDAALRRLKAEMSGEITYDSTSDLEVMQETEANLSVVDRINQLTAPEPEMVAVVDAEVGRWVYLELTGQGSIESLKNMPGGEDLYNTAKNAFEQVDRRLEENETLELQYIDVQRQLNTAQTDYDAIQQYVSIGQAIQNGTATPEQRSAYATAIQSGAFDPVSASSKLQDAQSRVSAYRAESETLLRQIQNNNDVLNQYGFGQGVEGWQDWYNSEEKQAELRQGLSRLVDAENQQGSNSNFATRDVLNAPPPRPLPKAQNIGAASTGGVDLRGVSAPFSIDSVRSADIHITAAIKDGSHADGDSLDFAVSGNPTDVGVVPMVSGTVVDVISGCREGDWDCGGGWGNRVLIRDAEGRLWNYAHLANVGVKPGDVVAQGANYLGTMGNTGASDGIHLHLNVSQDTEGNGVPYAEWALNVPVEQDARNANGSNLNGLGLQPRIVRRTGLNRNEAVMGSVPPGAVMLPSGAYYFEGQFYENTNGNPISNIRNARPASSVVDTYNPLRPTRASTRAVDYRDPNNVDHNYGYQFLEDNAQVRTKLHQVARNLMVPTQWLADVIATVTGGSFSTSTNGNGVGLLMFDQESARIVGYDLAQIGKMNAVQQLDLVEKYLSMGGELTGQYRSLENLWLAVWAGRENANMDVSEAMDNPTMREGLEWVSRIGNAAGRRYNSMHDLVTGGGHMTHTSYHPDCETCRALFMADGGSVTGGTAGHTTPSNTLRDYVVPSAIRGDSQFLSRVEQVSSNLGINPAWLVAVMDFETGGTFDPAEENQAGSGATGLIQFMPDTAAGLGTSTSALAQMSRVEQMQWVEKYLSPYSGQMRSVDDVYLAVFFPAAVGQADDWVLPGWAYDQNSGFDVDGSGTITKREITAKIRERVPRYRGVLPHAH